jgi:hypothetical protein
MPAPTLTSITISDTVIGSGEQPTVTFTFSEAVRNFDLTDVTAMGGFLDFFEQQGNATSPVWTARFNPFPNTDQSNQFVRVNLAGLNSSADGTAGVGTFDSVQRYTVDTIRPTVTNFTISDPVLRVGETATVTIKFSEAVTLPIGNLTAQQAVYSNLATADGGVTYTATLTPNANSQSNSVIALQLNGAVDAAGNTTGAAQPGPNLNLNTIRPGLTITIDDDTLRAGQTATVTFTFTESVNGFDFNDLSTFGIAGSLQSPIPTGLTTFTAAFIPFTNVTDLSNVFSVDMTGVTSATSGNAGAGIVQSPNIAVDTQRPTVSILMSDTDLGIGQASLVTFAFSEAVTGFTLGDVTYGNGALSALASSDGGVTWTSTFTPTPGLNLAGAISVDTANVTDLAGNAGVATASANYSIDSTAPTLLSVSLPAPALYLGNPMIVEFVFSEAITGFTTADITFPNARMGAPVTADNVTWYAALLPPLDAIDAPTNALKINLAGVTDAAGNIGVGTATSANYAVDTERPVVTITLSDYALAVGETAIVTFAFNGAVTGFGPSNVAAENGTVSAPTTADGGKTWTATYTPVAGRDDPTSLIRVAQTGIFDQIGNQGTGFVFSPNFAIDSTPPTATIAISDTAVTDGERPTITITFSEAMQPFTLSTPNGSIGAYTITDSGRTYTAVYTPNFSVNDADNLITFTGPVRDVAGNLLDGSPSSGNFTVTTSAPPSSGGPPGSPPPLAPPVTNGVVVLSGSVNSDHIFGTNEANRVSGGEGDDTVNGEMGDDTLSGDAGDDNLQGSKGSDSLMGGVGNDILHGGQDADFVQGGADNDLVFGDRGDDTVHGGQGDDQVFGGDGDDYISGDKGSDTLSGGAGADIFHLSGDPGRDLVLDFSQAEGDTVRLDAGTAFATAQVGMDTVISITGGGQMVLAGVSLASLTDGWIVVG